MISVSKKIIIFLFLCMGSSVKIYPMHTAQTDMDKIMNFSFTVACASLLIHQVGKQNQFLNTLSWLGMGSALTIGTLPLAFEAFSKEEYSKGLFLLTGTTMGVKIIYDKILNNSHSNYYVTISERRR